MPGFEGVLFDYGGVMTGPVRDSIATWLQRDQIDPESFSRTLKAWHSRRAPEGTPIHRLETGELSASEFDALLAAELVSIDGGPVRPAGLLQGIFDDLQLDPAMVAMVADLRSRDLKVGLLSNSWGRDFYPMKWIEDAFDEVVISADVGMRKPQPEIFKHALDLLDLDAATVIFVDDASRNVDAAEAVGLTGLLHVDSETTREGVASLLAQRREEI